MFWRPALPARRGRREVIDDRVRPRIADQVKVFIVVYYGHQVLFYIPAVTKDDDIFLIPEFRHYLPDHGSGKLQFGSLIFAPHAVSKRDGKVRYPVFIPYRDAEHNTDKTMPIQIIGAIMCRMVEQLGDILEFLSEFRDHGVIYTEEYRLGVQAVGDQAKGQPCCSIHKTRKVNFGIGAGIIECIQGL